MTAYTYPTVDLSAVAYDVLITAAAANTHMASRLGPDADAWATAVQDTRDKGLIAALAMFDAMSWLGEKTDESNTHCFPRSGLTDIEGTELDEDTIPTVVQQAYAELAAAIVRNPDLQDKASATGSNVQSVVSGSESVSFFAPKAGTRFPTAINDKLKPFLGGSTAVVAVAAEVFGTCEPDSFSDCDSYDDGGSLA